MNRIRLLPEQVANQIAAGEVVERPASVVKELVENALDAQAGRITVEIQAGGRSLVRVTDDGLGMSRDDALLCLERHATSKIQRAEDLAALVTMGFRGEALPFPEVAFTFVKDGRTVWQLPAQKSGGEMSERLAALRERLRAMLGQEKVLPVDFSAEISEPRESDESETFETAHPAGASQS